MPGDQMNRIHLSTKKRLKFTQFLDIAVNAYLHFKAKGFSKTHSQLAVFAHDHIGIRINVFGRYENEELSLLADYLQKDFSHIHKMTALDVGANIGNHSVFFADYFKDVSAFEPNPHSFHLLQLNASLKPNINCHNLGMSDIEGEGSLLINSRNIGGSRLQSGDAPSEHQKMQTVALKTLDDAEEINQKEIGLIKIDVEGHEIKVLRGAANLIKKQKPVILFEQNAGEIKNGTSESIEFLKSCGYSFLVFSVKEPPIVFRWNRFLKFFYYFLCGQCLEIAEREYFEKANYAMIIAKP